MTSLFKIAMNTHHMSHPLDVDKLRYQKWQNEGILMFAIATILTGGIAGIVILSTALLKYRRMKQIGISKESTKKTDEVSKNIHSKNIEVKEIEEKPKEKIQKSISPSQQEIEATKLCKLGAHFLFDKKDDVVAEQNLLEAVKLGNTKAKTLLGIMHSIKVQNTLACEWYIKAANEGDPEAQYHLAIAYEYGNGIEMDLKQSLYWYQKSYATSPKFMAGEAGDRIKYVQEKLNKLA